MLYADQVVVAFRVLEFCFCIAVCNFTNLDFVCSFFCFYFRLKTLFCPNDFGLYFIGLVLSSFKENIILLLSSGVNKMLKFSMEFLVFHDNNFCLRFFVLFFLFL